MDTNSDYLTITGPAGSLEARLDTPETGSGTTAVLCHPHPQYGGNMHDMVLDTLAGQLLAHGCAALRFNFRGVGASEGHYDNGAGEADDLMAIVHWANEHRPGELWVAGYSFGTSVIWRALPKLEPQPGRILLIAPPIGMMPFDEVAIGCPVDAIAGAQDEFVDQARFADWTGVNTHVIAGANHFFMGSHNALADQINALLA